MSQSSLLDPELLQNPYPRYAQTREQGRAVWEPEMLRGCWLVGRYDDVVALAKDGRMSADRTIAYTTYLDRGPPEAKALAEDFRRFMIYKDPPDHARLRGLVNRAFTPRSIARLRERIEAIVDELLDAALAQERFDVMEQFAFPLPATVIAEMMGIDRERWGQIRGWTDPIAEFFGNITGLKKAVAANVELVEFIKAEAADRRKHPGDDLISTLVRADDELGRLDDDELVSNAILLLLAGHHTTMNLIGNGLLALLRNPAQYARLREDPSLIPTAIDEMLRYDSPVQSVGRIAKEPMQVGDVEVKPGQIVVLLLGAANRDPAQFTDPDAFDVGRREGKHVSFAQGAHYCVGAPLALLEGEIAFRRLLQRTSVLALEDEPRYHANFSLRGLESLHVRQG